MTALTTAPLSRPAFPPATNSDGPASSRAAGLYFAGVAAPLPLRPAAALSRPVTPLRGPDHSFLAGLFAQAGLPLDRYRTGALLRRVPACLRFLGVRSLTEAASRLATRPALVWPLLDVVLLGVTQFCRDAAVFGALRERHLPHLLARQPHPRIWSAGCSEGQELYSVAACLAEHDALERCELLGTDCRPEAIARARAGEYAAGAVDQLPPAWSRTLFFPFRNSARIHPRLRTAVAWRVADLLAGAEQGPWDLIFCRNLAIYLEPAESAALWRRLAAQLAPGGLLVTGKAENPVASTGLFERIDACIYRQRTG